ncbi:DNA polymerase IV [Candidatus Parcubacteria bacterium]|nr:DNA polymerase IV [Candidatus Parcubacteria bacterium]
MAILHIDGDGFFASCEISLNPKLKGKPVVTGQERGIATAMSPEAKALGIHRGMPIFEIKKLFPTAVIVNSNYHTYGMFATRMYDIVRRFTERVEEYSIDECFAILEDKDREHTARLIKTTLGRELGMTFSVGVAPTKVLAKVASKWNKPDGFTILDNSSIHDFLKNLAVGKVWGIGPQTSHHLHSLGVVTALDFIERPERWIRENLSSPMLETWYELKGTPVYKVHESDDIQKSIQKTRTFPHTSEKKIILSELSHNVEGACIHARRDKLETKRIYYFLKTQEFRYKRCEIPLDVPTNDPMTILSLVQSTFDTLYKSGVEYRATGVTLSELRPTSLNQTDLFGEVVKNLKLKKIFDVVDKIDRKFGTGTVSLASSLTSVGRRHLHPTRRLNLPFMGEVV